MNARWDVGTLGLANFCNLCGIPDKGATKRFSEVIQNNQDNAMAAQDLISIDKK